MFYGMNQDRRRFLRIVDMFPRSSGHKLVDCKLCGVTGVILVERKRGALNIWIYLSCINLCSFDILNELKSLGTMFGSFRIDRYIFARIFSKSATRAL
jgi:hypothetical protein